MRDYIVHATRHHRVTVHKSIPTGDFNSYWRGPQRIRQFTILMFRKFFGGLEPTFCWHQDGFMAEAGDKRGNRINVEQVNSYHRYAPGATTMPRPLCPMVITVKQG